MSPQSARQRSRLADSNPGGTFMKQEVSDTYTPGDSQAASNQNILNPLHQHVFINPLVWTRTNVSNITFCIARTCGVHSGHGRFAAGRVGSTNVADIASLQLDIECLFCSYGEDMQVASGPPTRAHVIELVQRLSSHMAMQGSQESAVVQTSLGRTTVPGSTRRLGTCEHLRMSGFRGRCWRMWYGLTICAVLHPFALKQRR